MSTPHTSNDTDRSFARPVFNTVMVLAVIMLAWILVSHFTDKSNKTKSEKDKKQKIEEKQEEQEEPSAAPLPVRPTRAKAAIGAIETNRVGKNTEAERMLNAKGLSFNNAVSLSVKTTDEVKTNKVGQ